MSTSRSKPFGNSSHAKWADYSGVTETPGTLISREAASMAVSRYEIARRLSTARRVLEIACGSGQGLGYVAAVAERVIGGDVTASLLERARQHYRSRIPLARFDAHELPFSDRSFDVVEIHEAIYYMEDPRRVFLECRRVLRHDGALIVSSVNPAWPDFNPSPYSTHYLGAGELSDILHEIFHTVDMRFGFAMSPATPAGAIVSALKRAAVRLKVMPRTMRGKVLLKRLFLGPLLPVPAELTPGLAPIQDPQRAVIAEASQFRILYAVARTSPPEHSTDAVTSKQCVA
jgi:ubiquinone/menaquinone biosynthesis C-methylase UbiE